MTFIVGAALIGLGLLLAQALAVAAIAFVRPRGNVYTTIVLVACATTPVVFLAGPSIVGLPLSIEGRVYLALMHLSLGGLLFHFMTLPDRSVTLRILVELLLAPGRALSLDELTARYGVRRMIASRLEQLQDGRCLTIGPDESITLLPGGQTFGRFVTAGRRLFRITSAN